MVVAPQSTIKPKENLYLKALELIKKFNYNRNFNKQYLVEASKLLVQVLEGEKTHAGAYFNLAYIFYLLNKDTLALKYLNKAKINGFETEKVLKLEGLLKKPTATKTPEKFFISMQNKDSSYLGLELEKVKELDFSGIDIKYENNIVSKTSLGERIKKIEAEETSKTERTMVKFEFENNSKTTLASRIARAQRIIQK